MGKPLKYGLFLVGGISLINFILILIFSVFWSKFPAYSLGQMLIFIFTSLISGLLISAIVLFTAPLFKDFLITYRSLLRLENLSHPLLIRLSLEAAGTYHHSLAVANLAYKAAKSIGADALLTRVGAYYHDIGKLENPEYFIENQQNGDNIHETINDPKKSNEIIVGHVKYGLRLAEEYKLPKEIAAFIPEHQGTNLVSYFFDEAKDRGLKVNKEDFRYPGPKPLSKETAITMLADAIEAKIRLLDKVTPDKITEIVNEIIDQRLKEKQLELSGLSEQDIVKIRKSFIQTLLVMFHQRIDYPDGNKQHVKFKIKNLFTK